MAPFVTSNPLHKAWQNVSRGVSVVRTAKSEKLKKMVAEIVTEVEAYEHQQGLRKRARKAEPQATFLLAVEAVICDVLHAHELDPDMWTPVPRSNRKLSNRDVYRPATHTKALTPLIDILKSEEIGLIDFKLGNRDFGFEGEDYKAYPSIIKAMPKLIARAEPLELELWDFGRHESEQVIELRKKKDRHLASKEPAQYEDNAETIRMRQELHEINAWLADVNLYVTAETSQVIDPTQTRLHRIFNNEDWNQGGRLYRGFWIDGSFSKKMRRTGLLIEDEPIAELDFGQMALRLLYINEGLSLPCGGDSGDLYAIPGLESYSRDGIKELINAALCSDFELDRFPKGTRKHFPDNQTTFNMVMDKIRAFHAPIAAQFYTGVGLRLQRQDSDIMVKILLRAKAQDLILLPLHDGVLCQKKKKLEAKELMETVFREETGADAVVRIEYG